MFHLFRKRWKLPSQEVQLIEAPLPPEESQQAVDFAAIVSTLTALSKSAQMTFLYRYVLTLSPNMCRSLIRYAHERLNEVQRKTIANRKANLETPPEVPYPDSSYID